MFLKGVQHFDKFVEGLKNIWEGGVKKMVEGAKEFGLGLYHLLMDIFLLPIVQKVIVGLIFHQFRN